MAGIVGTIAARLDSTLSYTSLQKFTVNATVVADNSQYPHPFLTMGG